MTIDIFLTKLKNTPGEISFNETISVIEEFYEFTPTAFRNGNLYNEGGQNNGSCKILSFAKLQNLSEKETLQCFGDYYRKDVLENPDGEDHQNIRNFMKTGWAGVQFKGEALWTHIGLKIDGFGAMKLKSEFVKK